MWLDSQLLITRVDNILKTRRIIFMSVYSLFSVHPSKFYLSDSVKWEGLISHLRKVVSSLLAMAWICGMDFSRVLFWVADLI